MARFPQEILDVIVAELGELDGGESNQGERRARLAAFSQVNRQCRRAAESVWFRRYWMDLDYSNIDDECTKLRDLMLDRPERLGYRWSAPSSLAVMWRTLG